MKKVALITGSSRGIGAACAEALAEAGYAVCINYIEREDKAEELAALLRAEGRRVICHRADVADPEAVREMVRRTERELGRIELLVNNAGIAQQFMFQDISPEYWQRIFAVNLGGATARDVKDLLHQVSDIVFEKSGIRLEPEVRIW